MNHRNSIQISEEQIERLKDAAIKRSGQIFLPPACSGWREAITVECGRLFLWYDTPLGDIYESGIMTTRVVTERLEVGPW